jgi:hypothetical protein
MNAMKSVMKRSQQFPDSILRYFYSYKIIGLFSLLLLMGSFSVCEAATECDKNRVDSFVKNDGSVDIKNIQKNLKMVGYDLTDADIKTGVYGPKTSGALVNFCEDLEATEQKDKIDLLIDTLSEIASDVEETDWIESLDDDQYINWFTALPENIQSNIKSVNSENEPRSSVIYTYYNNYKTESIIPDINWVAEDCGCSPEVSDADRYTNFLYGFYSFQSAGEEQVINFSVLSRIGYFSLSPDKDFRISNVRHWKNERPASAFIDLAHQYKAKVDLVIYDSGWSKWNDSPTEYIIDKYASRIDELVKEKIKDYPVNDIKPVVSFGTSPSRTMGDGVTLSFDFNLNDEFKDANPSQKKNVFNNIKKFIEKLKLKLDDGSQKEKKIAGNVDEYFLNVMWPVEDILSDSDSYSFYSLENMIKLSESVNLFILVKNDFLNNTSEGSKEKRAKLALENLKNIRVKIDTLDVSQANILLAKILPLYLFADEGSKQVSSEAEEGTATDNEAGNVEVNVTDAETVTHTAEASTEATTEGSKEESETEASKHLRNYFNYAEWNFSGVGLWSMPLSPSTDVALKDVFLNVNASQGLNGLGDYTDVVCSLMCPYRWVTRIGLFLLFVIVVVYAFMSTWICESKSIFGKWYVTVGICIGILVLILTFWCDPYWKNQHDLLIFFSIVIGVLTTIWLIIKKRREALFP